MKHLLTVSAFTLCLGLLAGTASPSPKPGYCGPAADTAAIQTLWLRTWGRHLDATYINAMAVLGNYAELGFDYKGADNAYYHKQGSTWHLTTYGDVTDPSTPKSWPPSVIAKFVSLWRLGNGLKCRNPHYVDHPMA